MHGIVYISWKQYYYPEYTIIIQQEIVAKWTSQGHYAIMCHNLTVPNTMPQHRNDEPWWRHNMETLSVLLTLCGGNPQITGGLSSQRVGNMGFDILNVSPK